MGKELQKNPKSSHHHLWKKLTMKETLLILRKDRKAIIKHIQENLASVKERFSAELPSVIQLIPGELTEEERLVFNQLELQ